MYMARNTVKDYEVEAMKKIIAVILVLLALLFSGCASVSQPQPSAMPVPTPTPEPIPTPTPEPETLPGTVLYSPAPAVLAVLQRGDSVDILEDMGELCRVRCGELTGLMEKRLLRPASAGTYVPWKAYAGYQAVLFDNFRLSGEGEQLGLNTELEVIDACGDCLVICVGDKTGYILASGVSQYPLQYWDSGGGGGGSSGGGGADGGDITLSSRPSSGGWYVKPLSAGPACPAPAMELLSSVEESPVPSDLIYSGAATVLADGAELVLVWFEPGEEVRVLSADSVSCTVYYEEQTASLSRFLVLVEGDKAYTPWEGYAKMNAVCHSDYYLNDSEPKRLNVNTVLSVIGELENCYAVSLEGACVFIAKDSVSETQVYTGWDGGGGGGDGSGDWSPPVL